MDRENLHNLNENITDAERIALLEQLLEEEDVLEQLTSLELAPMPAYLEEEILEAILGEKQQVKVIMSEQAQENVQRSIYRPPKWLQLFSYSVKITFATACAIAALFRMPDMGPLNREQMAIEREQETQAREEETAKKQQQMLAEQEKRHQKDGANSSYIADALQFILEKIFIGGMDND